jgi:hypothetical protein
MAVPFYTGNGLALVIGWTSLLINGFINFVIPLTLYYLSHTRTFEHHRPHMFVKTAGKHHSQLITAEITNINSGLGKLKF